MDDYYKWSKEEGVHIPVTCISQRQIFNQESWSVMEKYVHKLSW